jgi:hypothetical protein
MLSKVDLAIAALLESPWSQSDSPNSGPRLIQVQQGNTRVFCVHTVSILVASILSDII